MIYVVVLMLMTSTAMGLLFAGALCRSGQIEDRMRGWTYPHEPVPAPRDAAHDREPDCEPVST